MKKLAHILIFSTILLSGMEALTQTARSKQEILSRMRAVGTAAAIACLTEKDGWSEDKSYKMLIQSLKNNGVYDQLNWLTSANGTMAIKIGIEHTTSICTDMRDQDNMTKKIFPYVR